MEDMILDMDTFDFSQIDSDLVLVPAKGSPAEVEEDIDGVEFEEAEVEDEEEIVEEEAEEEEVSEDAEEVSDEEEVEFENYEITLPSGENVVLSDLVQGYKAAEEVRVMREEVESVKADFEAKSGNLVSMLELAKLEVDSVISEYEDTDWNDLANEDPHSYAQHRSYFDKHKARSKELKAAMNDMAERKANEEKAIHQEKVQNAVTRLQREIPGWGPQKYQTLVDYAVGMGGDRDELLATSDPLVFLALNKAMDFEKGKQSVKAKVKKVGSPRKVVKATAKTPAVSKNVQREALIKKAQAEGDHAALFNFIKD